MQPLNVNLIVNHLYHVSNWSHLLALSLHICYVTGSDGFMYTSVSAGNHTVTVRGTSQDGQIAEVTLDALSKYWQKISANWLQFVKFFTTNIINVIIIWYLFSCRFYIYCKWINFGTRHYNNNYGKFW